MADVESLELQVTGDATYAKKSLDALIDTLGRLRKATSGGCGLSAVAKGLQQVNDSGKGVSTSNAKSAKSFANLAAKVTAASLVLKKGANRIASWIKESNDYVENLNLFNVAMGEYADSAKRYAEEVGDLMGIDPSSWMRNQGVFKTLTSGFGVATDRAAKMSEQLTQLGYDISSFYNTSVEDAMTKLQSGISGEIEPLRRLGYDLSQAKLEATALSLGIDQAVSSMTQAEKAELRYYAIMTQVTAAQGDMARTLSAPANQLRILQAQVTQAARALGNIFIPALNAVLPWAIALFKVIRDLASSIASLFGFSLPTIDNSAFVSVSGGASDASDAIDEATGSARKFKKTLLGIDELNVMNDDTSGGGGGIDVGGGGGGFDYELPEYDFLGDVEKNVDGIYKKLKKMLRPLRKILDILYDYKDLVIAGLGVVAVGKLWTALSGLWTSFMGLAIVDTFIDGFKIMGLTGAGFFTSLNSGITNVRGNLSGIQKAAIVAVAGFAEFGVIKNSVYDLAMGCEDVGTKIVQIGVVAAAAGAAMYVALGPAGLAVTAIIGIAGAIAGFAQAQSDLQREQVDASFYDGVGVSLDALKIRLEAVTEQYRVQNQQIGEWGEKILANNESIDRVNLKIQTLHTTLGAEGVVTQEEIDKIKEQFHALYESISENLSLSAEIITTALVGALQRATPEIAGQIDVLIGEYQRYVRETQGRAEELKLLIDNGYDQLVGKQKNDPAYQQIMENINAWYLELGTLAGGMSETGWQWQQTVGKFKVEEIDFGAGPEKAKEKLDEIAAAGGAALEDLAAAREAVLREIDSQIDYASKYRTQEDVDLLLDVKAALEEDYAAQEGAIKSELNSIFEDVQNGMITEIHGVKESNEKAWSEMSWFDKWWNDNDEEKYVRDGLRKMQDDVDTISGTIEGHMNTLETDGSVWADDAMQGILDSLFETNATSSDLSGLTTYYYSYKTTLDDAIENVFSDLEKSGKKQSSEAGKDITRGLTEGVTDKSAVRELSDAGELLVEAVNGSVCRVAEIRSPSKLFAELGGYMVEGLVKGIKDKMSILKANVATAINSAFDNLDASKRGYNYGSSFAQGIIKAIKNASFPTITGTVNTSGGSPGVSFRAYASGGYPPAGQMFIANEAGPELVGSIGNRTAVVNNDQIVESVSKGVYKAVAQAMGQSGGSQVVEAKVNDKVLFEVVVDRNRRETLRTGFSPLFGGV